MGVGKAGVTADMNTLNAGSVSFYDWAQQQGETLAADTGTPAVGDSIVFFEPSLVGIYADHVGIVTSVNPDGTINMVNGDFLGSSDVHVEYDTDISLTSWATMWGPGEEWFIVTPPNAPRQPVPTATMSAPRTAVTGTDAVFRARASMRGGSITAYYWTFGDGRTTNATGPDVTHVYSRSRHLHRVCHRDLELRHDHHADQGRHRPRRLVRGRGGARRFRVVRDDASRRVHVRPCGRGVGGADLGWRELA